MKKFVPYLASGLGLLSIAISNLSHAGDSPSANNLADALKQHDTHLELRYRVEAVDLDNDTLDTGIASTLRTRLTYQSARYLNSRLLLEFDNVTLLGDDSYNNFRNGAARARIADDRGTEVNQASLSYQGLDNLTFIFGRQRINLANQRFVGGVGWRQNEQTYDAASVRFKHDKTTAHYSYLARVNDIFANNTRHDSHLLQIDNNQLTNHHISLYGQWLNDRDVADNANATQTLGVRFQGSSQPWHYTIEYAQQSDYKDRASEFSTGYWHAELAFAAEMLRVTFGTEVLESDDGIAFQTPLATKHAFQGWSDQFLATPAAGLNDVYVKLAGTVSETKLSAAFHHFTATESVEADNYGQEVNLSAARKFGSVNALLKYAYYQADDFSVDTHKIWLMLAARF